MIWIKVYSKHTKYIMFAKYFLDLHSNIFDELSTSVEFENITNGRDGAILIDSNNIGGTNLIPLARSTTIYKKPAQHFLPIHHNIIKKINETVGENNNFNNAMIEIYDNNYRSMKFHSDQSLDLAEDSYICLYSCYSQDILQSENNNARKLKVKSKDSDEQFEFTLDNNSIILFSLSTNSKYLHKIVLDAMNTGTMSNNKWLGITFRLSKTFIHFVNELPYFYSKNSMDDLQQLTLVTDIEKKEFYKCRSLENLHNDYTYPNITYTISISDTLSIK